jgi:hypothetical protein
MVSRIDPATNCVIDVWVPSSAGTEIDWLRIG